MSFICTILYFYVCIPYSKLTTQNFVSIYHHTVDIIYLFHPSPTPFPLVISTLFSISTFFLGGWLVHFFCFLVIFFILHIWVRSYGICLWIISLSIMPSRHTYVPKGKLYIQWNIYIHLNIYIFHQGRILNPIGSLPFILRKTLSNSELKLISKSS